MLIDYIKVFAVGGVLCAIGQILIDKTKLTPARILTVYVVAGLILEAVGLYSPLVKWAEAGATVPLTGFGSTLAKGVEKAFSAHSPAASRQPQPASAQPCSSESSSRFCSGRKQKAENSKRTEQLSSVRLRYTYQAAVSKLSTAVTLFTKSVSASLSINHSFSPYWISKSPRKSPGGQAALREKLRLFNYLMEKNASMPGY